ncbi:MAG: putative lipoprotein [Flavipsychrobacter sp.]|jgi:hypothetical protein|nr:putative lipoprotein [Flavipsychrobacter sp.]
MMKKITAILAAACIIITASCTNKANEQALQAQQRTIDSMKIEMVKKHVIDSMNAIAQQQALVSVPVVSPVEATPVVKHIVKHKRQRATRNTDAGYASSNSYYGATPAATPVPAPIEQPRKKGWSAKATGSLIGVGAGAVTGALANKRNRGAGAVIGGLIGAAAGLGTGAIIDHKKGR